MRRWRGPQELEAARHVDCDFCREKLMKDRKRLSTKSVGSARRTSLRAAWREDIDPGTLFPAVTVLEHSRLRRHVPHATEPRPLWLQRNRV